MNSAKRYRLGGSNETTDEREEATFREAARLRLLQTSPRFKKRDHYFRFATIALWLTFYVCGLLSIPSKSKHSPFESSTHMKIGAVMFVTVCLIGLLEWRKRKSMDAEIRRSFKLDDFKAVEAAVEQKHGKVF